MVHEEGRGTGAENPPRDGSSLRSELQGRSPWDLVTPPAGRGVPPPLRPHPLPLNVWISDSPNKEDVVYSVRDQCAWSAFTWPRPGVDQKPSYMPPEGRPGYRVREAGSGTCPGRQWLGRCAWWARTASGALVQVCVVGRTCRGFGFTLANLGLFLFFFKVCVIHYSLM